MKDNLNKPCQECPFRKDSLRGWLGGESAEDTHRFVMAEQDFACHMTRGKKDQAKMSRCFGSLQYINKNCKVPFRNKPLIAAVKRVSLTSNEGILDCKQFIEHHSESWVAKS